MSGDSHFREELGVNQYTTPSIEQLFNTLDSLKPIPIQELTRPPRALHLDNRVKFALSFGVLIGDEHLVDYIDRLYRRVQAREKLVISRGILALRVPPAAPDGFEMVCGAGGHFQSAGIRRRPDICGEFRRTPSAPARCKGVG